MKKLYIYTILVGLFAISCTQESESTDLPMADVSALSLSTEQFQALGVELGSLNQVSFPEYIAVRGLIDVPPTHRASINVFHGGYVHNLDLLPGKQVKRGELLFTLQNPAFIDIQKNYLEVQAKLNFLESDYLRQRQLSEEAISSEKKYKQAESDYLMAKAELSSLKEQLVLININPQKLSSDNIRSEVPIYSPIDGFVTKLDVNRGAYLTPEREAMQIINATHKHLELKVYEKDVTRIKEGQRIQFRIDDSENLYTGEVHMIEKSINQEDRTVQVHCHLPDVESPFIVGMYVEAEVELNVSSVYALPRSALVDMDGKQMIVVKRSEADGQMEFDYLEVVPGRISGDLVEVLNASSLVEKQIVLKGAFELLN